ncbi:hypothetical protein LDENG_00200360 [Lucifuga dentata]|nr:hypothetical protein LDENG_00200360 [Lucifuga dentata]
MLANQILCVERTNLDSLVIVLGDFNKVNNAYLAVPCAALGHSNHVMVHLIPTYKQKLKLSKPVVRTSELQRIFRHAWTADWDVFRSTTSSLDESTEAVMSNISF